MKKYIEERAVEIANYIIENNATVRQAAKHFGISKSTVHVVVTIGNDGKVNWFGQLNRRKTGTLPVENRKCFWYNKEHEIYYRRRVNLTIK